MSAQWTVPTLSCGATPNGFMADWVGVDGFTNSNYLFQDGQISYCESGSQVDYAWWTDQSDNFEAQDLFSVAPGDVVSAAVLEQSADKWEYEVRDLSNGESASGVEAYTGPAASAEWITEDPGDPNTGGLYPFADFGTVTFSDLGLTTPSGSWTTPPYSDAGELVSSSGSVEAMPGEVSGSGSSAAFTVTYEAPASGGSVVMAPLRRLPTTVAHR